jgi:periplasmic protein TonB
MRAHRRETLVWAVLVSLALHLTLLVFLLLIIPPTEPEASASEPLTVDVVVGEGAAGATSEPPAPTEAAAEPVAPDVPPTPVPDEPPPPPVQQAELPPPTPEPAPDVPPPPPVQVTETPPPPPVPIPKVPPPPRPVARVHPPQPPPQRVAAVASVNPAGPPAQAPPGPPAQAPEGQNSGQNGASRGGGASNGAAWTGKLKQWWDQHSFYPSEASRTNEGGSVRVRIVVAPDGQVTSIQVVQGSGTSVLDAAALAVFRNARLPPFPPGTPAPPADVVVTLHYRPADGGG